MEESKHVRFVQLLELHLNSVIKKEFSKKTLTTDVLHEIHDTIKEKISSVFNASKHKLCEPAIVWLAAQYFKSITIATTDNEKAVVGELVVFNEYKLADLPYHDIELLRNLFGSADWADKLNEEYGSRSKS